MLGDLGLKEEPGCLTSCQRSYCLLLQFPTDPEVCAGGTYLLLGDQMFHFPTTCWSTTTHHGHESVRRMRHNLIRVAFRSHSPVPKRTGISFHQRRACALYDHTPALGSAFQIVMRVDSAPAEAPTRVFAPPEAPPEQQTDYTMCVVYLLRMVLVLDRSQ